ncbi:hypothetical protein [Pelagibacterium lentulum]|nr:hypothetical protein [Pelagibacterium lentulum]
MNEPRNHAALVLNASDNVAVTLDQVRAKAEIGPDLLCARRISIGHKVIIQATAEGASVRKFGQIIGSATPGRGTGGHRNCAG